MMDTNWYGVVTKEALQCAHIERFSELYPENIQPPNSREMVSTIDLGGLWVLQAFDRCGDEGPDGIRFGTGNGSG